MTDRGREKSGDAQMAVTSSDPIDQMKEMDLFVSFTWFPSKSGTVAKGVVRPWSRFVERLGQVPRQLVKESSPMVKLATFGTTRTAKGSLRHDKNVLEVTGVEGDYDGQEVPPEEAVRRLEHHHVKAVILTTWSHTPEAPRWRVFAPLSRPVEPKERQRLVAALNGMLGGILGSESFTLSQSYFIGGKPGGDYRVLATFDDPGEAPCLDDRDPIELDEVAVYPEGERADASLDVSPNPSSYLDYYRALQCGGPVHEAARGLVARWVAKGLPDDEIRELMSPLAAQVAAVRGAERAEGLMGEELSRLIDGARGKGFEVRQKAAHIRAQLTGHKP